VGRLYNPANGVLRKSWVFVLVLATLPDPYGFEPKLGDLRTRTT